MLPDFPRLKNKLYKLFLLGMYYEPLNISPLLGMIKKRAIREGNVHSIIQENNKRITELKRFSTTLSFKMDEILDLPLEKIYERYKAVALELGKQKAQQMYTEIDKIVNEVGNVVSTRGRPMSPEILFELFDKMHIDFNSDGSIIWPAFVGNKQTAEKFIQLLKELEQEPYKTMMENIIEKKRMEFNDRESNRKLVD